MNECVCACEVPGLRMGACVYMCMCARVSKCVCICVYMCVCLIQKCNRFAR